MEQQNALPEFEPRVFAMNEDGSVNDALLMRTTSTVSKCHIDGCDDGDY